MDYGIDFAGIGEQLRRIAFDQIGHQRDDLAGSLGECRKPSAIEIDRDDTPAPFDLFELVYQLAAKTAGGTCYHHGLSGYSLSGAHKPSQISVPRGERPDLETGRDVFRSRACKLGDIVLGHLYDPGDDMLG